MTKTYLYSDSVIVITDAYHPPMILDIHVSLQNSTQNQQITYREFLAPDR